MEGKSMGTPNDASSSTTIQSCIGKLFAIENVVTYLGYQLKEVSTCLVGVSHGMNTERVKAEDLALMDKMTTDELRQMANIEHTRRGLIDEWRKVEELKRVIIDQAKTRITDQGRD
jgi:hypothetical protein